MEVAMHATGRYPSWWTGRRWDRPVVAWAAGITGESTRDNPQRILLGRAEEGGYGTGTLPKESIANVSSSRGMANAVDTIQVRHISGGTSQIAFKTYEKGREKWQGETLDFVWFDEEPPQDIYIEGLTRTMATGGMVFITFTPLLGMSDVVTRFLIEKPISTYDVQMTIDDVEHYTEAQKAAIIAGWPAHEREARAKGIPHLGSGRVFPFLEDTIKCPSIPIPDHWPRIGGIDFGWDHPSAGVLLAWDRDSDVLYVTTAHRASQNTPVMFSAAVKPWGPWPWAWPHDGLQHDKGSGEQLAKQYRDNGLNMLPERATFEDGTNGLEAGIAEMYDRMQTGRLKVFAHLLDWFQEFNMYHREDGQIVKKRDDLLSATRYAMMMKRFAKTRQELKPRRERVMMESVSSPNSWMSV
jgi:phage terminase large subunit-like protein